MAAAESGGSDNGRDPSSSSLVATAEEQQQQRQPGTGRVKGRSSAADISRRNLNTARPEENQNENEQPDLLRTALSILAALFIGKLALGFLSPPADEPQDTYFFSSRSMVSVTSIGEDGKRRTNVQEDSSIRTNIKGLGSGSVTESPEASPQAQLFIPRAFFDPFP